MSARGIVILFRAGSDDHVEEAYTSAFPAVFTVQTIRSTSIISVHHEAVPYDRFDALILTSKSTREYLRAFPPPARTYPVHVLGSATATAVPPGHSTECIFAYPKVTNAATLAQALPIPTSGRPYLHLCSKQTRSDLRQGLSERGIVLHEQPVYDSAASPTLWQDFQDAMLTMMRGKSVQCPITTWFVFFSPSGVDAVFQTLRCVPAPSLPDLASTPSQVIMQPRFAAIGSTTAKALDGWRMTRLTVPVGELENHRVWVDLRVTGEVAVAARPTPTGVVEAISRYSRPEPRTSS